MSNFQLSEYPLIIVTSHYFSFSFPHSLPFPFPSSPTPTPTLPLSPSLSPQVTYTVCMLVKVTCAHVQYDLKLSHPLTNTNSIHVLCGFVKVSHHTWRVHVYTNHKLIITWFTCKAVVCAYIAHVFMNSFQWLLSSCINEGYLLPTWIWKSFADASTKWSSLFALKLWQHFFQTEVGNLSLHLCVQFTHTVR